ncbi:MAG: hypothetical protein LBP31_02410, partial [Holosporales bacterium]|nr:hypothetical protein [Holosporales bacterium]
HTDRREQQLPKLPTLYSIPVLPYLKNRKKKEVTPQPTIIHKSLAMRDLRVYKFIRYETTQGPLKHGIDVFIETVLLSYQQWYHLLCLISYELGQTAGPSKSGHSSADSKHWKKSNQHTHF